MRKKWLCSGLACVSLLAFCAAGHAGARTPQAAHLQEEAVRLARNEDYGQSLELFEKLADAGEQDEAYWRDYITVLCWAGKFEQAARLTRERYQSFDDLPDYMLKALEGAYQALRMDDEVLAALRPLADRGDADAKLRYAERLTAAGRLSEGEDAYRAALGQGKIPAHRIYFSWSVSELARGDMVSADEYFRKARRSLENDPDEARLVKDMEAQFAALLIRENEIGRAEHILKRYVDEGSATPRMTADYLIALRYGGKPALKEFERLCPDWDQVPLYGLQSMGDAYFRQKEYKKAEKVYAYLLKKDPDVYFAAAARAYCLAMLGREKNALAEYKRIAAKYPAAHPALAADGLSYIAEGKIHLARAVFSFLGTTPEEKKAYQYQYAKALSENGVYHEAQKRLGELAKEEGYEGKALSAMAMNLTRRGLYRDAERILSQEDLLRAGTREYSAARILYDERITGGLYAGYAHSADYKGNDNSSYYMSRENDLGGNLFLLTGLDREYLRDDTASASFTHTSAGLSYRYGEGRTDLSFVRTTGDARQTGARFYTEYEANDLAKFSLSAGKRPHGAAGAAWRGIDERYGIFSWEQRIDADNVFSAAYERNALSDENRFDAYRVQFARDTLRTAAKRDRLLVNYGWSGYDFASPHYESPRRRINYGVGFGRKWFLPERGRSWEWTMTADWGRDDDEPTDFSPYTRVEFSQAFRANQSLSIGAEYGWRTNRLRQNDSLLHGYAQIDFNYSWEW